MAEILKTLIPAGGGDYTLMATAEATDQQDLVAGGNTYVLECYTGQSTENQVRWDGWTCDATHFVTVRAAAGHEHGGVKGAGYELKTTSGSGAGLENILPYSVFDGFGIQHTGSAGEGAHADWPADNTTFSNLIIHTTAGNLYTGIRVRVNITGTVIKNCLIELGPTTWTGISIESQTEILGCTVVGVGDTGTALGCYRASSPATVKDCLGYSDNLPAFALNGSSWVSPENNASWDATAPGTNPQTSITTADFVDYAGGDYTPAASGKLDSTGTYIASTDPDIAGNPRGNPNCEIGAYEIVAAGPVISTIKSDGDFTTLSAWETWAQGQFGTTPNEYIAECYNDFGGPLNDALYLDGWGSTTATNHPTVRPAAGQGHGGVWGVGFTLQPSQGSPAVTAAQAHSLLQGISIINGGSGSGVLAYSDAVLDSCIVVGGGHFGINLSGGRAVNCVAKADSNWAIAADAPAGSVIESCSAYGASAGVYTAGNNAECINTVAVSASTSFLGTFIGNSGNNASRDSSAPGTNPVINVSTAAGVDLEDITNNNLNPVASGKLDGAGADLSGTFTDDITGFTRVAPWEIGAYEIQGAPPTGVTVSGNVLAQSALSAGTLDAFAVVDVTGTVTSQVATSAGDVTVIDVIRSVVLSLTDEFGTPAANLSGLKWAWFDEATPDLFLAPTDQGTGETTDGSGQLVVQIPNTTLDAGQVGWLTVTDSDGTTTQDPAHKGFAGPAEVS